MGLPRVAAFTDSYLPTVNGVTYTVRTWRQHWESRGGQMDVVYPESGYEPGPGEHPVGSVPFPFYEGFRIGVPGVPKAVAGAALVHVHTPFGLGLAGLRLARRHDLPVLASYHTPTSEYAEYLASNPTIERAIERGATGYERRFLDRTDLVITPSERTAEHVRDAVGTTTPVDVVSNGVDIDFFRPVDTAAFRERHDLPDGTLVGYTGRHGFEKGLDEILAAVDGLDGPSGLDDLTVVFGGDGPARGTLERRAATVDADVRFLGFLDREELPAFYSSLSAFLFPSPVETQGLVALEANACGTPVVGVDAGALADTVVEGVTGHRFERGDTEGFRDAIRRTLRESAALGESCLERRESTSVEHAVDRLAAVYDTVL